MSAPSTLPKELPTRLRARAKAGGKIWYYFDTGGKPRKEIPLGKSRRKALIEYEVLINVENSKKQRTPQNHHYALFTRAKKGAKGRGVQFTLTRDDVLEMLVRSNYSCELTGIEFDFRKNNGQRIRPWIPIIDRKDSNKPYDKDNCRVVCAAVNIALNQFGDEILISIARGIIKKKSSDSRKFED